MEKIKAAIEKATATRRSTTRRPSTALVRRAKGVVNREWAAPAEVRIVEPQQKVVESNRLLAFGDGDAGFAGFDILRTRVLQTIREQGWRSIAITSPGPKVGKTFVAINLAASIARLAEEKPLLVDFDFRRPAIAQTFGLSPELSLIDCLTGHVPPSDVFIQTRKPPLNILPNTRPIPNPSEVVASPRVKAMVEELNSGHDWSVTIFDLPPLLSNDDVLAFLPNVDCTLFVVALGLTTSKEIEECSELLMPYNFLGYVANKSDENVSEYY